VTHVTDPLVEPMRIRHLLTHTSGLTYGFHRVHPMDELHRAAGFEMRVPEGADLARCCELWAGIPLLFQPGSEWNYSVATDVLGRVVEVASGQTLDAFFRERILGPLGMDDTGFFVPAEEMGRAAALYVPAPGTRKAVRTDQIGVLSPRLPMMLSGGAGLISTIGDYHRFTQMLRGGGQLDGVRLLGPRTVAYMTRNHLPGNAELSQFGRALYAETPLNGVGFGLGFSVVIDPVRYGTLSSVGEYAWGGMASTAFWIDPVEDLTAILMTQLLPSSTHPVRSRLRQAVYQAVME
jgi:CubicO group peptidase (beta-lactamase class C family)